MGDPADQVRALSAPRLRQRLAQAFAAVLIIGCAAYEIAAPGGVVSLRLPTDTVRIGVGDSVVIRPLALDASGSLLANRPVAWSSSAPAVATVDEQNVLRALTPGSALITAAVDTFEATATVIVSDVPALLEIVAGDGQSGAGGAAVTTVPRVRVSGTTNAPLAGVEVTFAVTAGGGTLLDPAAAITDAAGEASPGGWVLGTAIGTNTLTATIAGSGVTGNPVTFTATATAGPPSAGHSGVSATPASIGASSGAERSTITVTVRDALGNVVPGASVTLAATGAGNTITQPAAPTDAQGRATGQLSSTTVGTKVITATVAGSVVVDSTATVVVTPGAAASVTSIAGQGQTATVSTSVAIAPRVRVVDAFGTAVPGAEVTFAVTAGGGSVAPLTAVVTDAAGEAAATLWTLGGATGANTLTATVAGAGITGNPVTFSASAVAGAPSAARIGVSAAPATIAASSGTQQSVITVTVRDANGNVVPGTTVSLGATGTGNTITQPAAPTDAQGRTTGAVSSTATGAKVITATIAGSVVADSTATVTVTPGAASTVQVVAGDAQSAAVNSAVATAPRVRVADAFGSGVAGVSVTFAMASGGGTVTAPATVVTDAAGEAAPGGWVLGPAAGANTLTATASGAGLTGNPVTFTATATVGAPSAARSGLAIVPSSVAQSAGDSFTDVTVTVRDANGSTVMGASVTLAATGSGNIITQPVATTDAQGRATGRVASSIAGAKVISAVVNGTIALDSTATLTVTSLAAESVAGISADAQSSAVNSAVAEAPAVRVLGAGGIPVAGVSVTFAVTGGGGSITGPTSVLTDAAGDARVGGWVLGPAAGANTLTATVAGAGITGNPVTFTATATVGPPSAARSGLAISPTSVPQSDGSAFTDVTVTVRDADGSTVMGASVQIAATGSGNILTQPAATTDAQGRATARVASSIAGAKVISAIVNGAVAIDSTATLTVTALAPASVAGISADGQSSAVNTAVAEAPAVRVLGAGGIAVEGATVTFAVTGGGGSITGSATVLTDVNGDARAGGWVLGPAAGANTLTATVSGAGITGNPVTFTATATVGPPSAARSGLGIAPATIAQSDGSASSLVTVTVRDADGSTIMGATVALAATGTGNIITQPVGTTDAQGRITGRVASTVAESKTISAVVNGTVTIDSTALLEVIAATPESVIRISADGQTATVGSAVTEAPAVRVLAAGNVPVGGVEVTFTVSGGGGSLAAPTTVTTDAAGEARAGAWTLGTAPGTNTVTATVTGAGITGNPLDFSATALVGAPDAQRSGVVSTSDSITASGGADQATITVTVRDAFGNVVPGASVTLAATGSGNTVTQPVAVTDANGVTTGTLSSTIAATKVVSAVVNGTVALDSVAPVVVRPATPFVVSLLEGDAQSAPVSTDVPTVPAVRVVDAFGTAVAGREVTFAVVSGGGSVVGPAVVLTDASGDARPGGWTLGAAPGANTLSATVTGTGITGNPVTFTATALVGLPSAARSGVRALPATITASNDSLTSTISVNVRDANGNPVEGVTVALSATGSGNTITQPAAPTDAAGLATGAISSTTIGTKVVSALLDGAVTVDSTASVLVELGPPVSVSLLEGDAQVARVLQPVAIVPAVRVLGAGGLPVSGVEVTFAVTSGGGSVTGAAVVLTDANGDARPGGWTLGITAGANTLTATVTDAGVTGNPVTFTATAELGVPDAARSGLTASPDTIQASSGTQESIITVRLRDAAGDPVAGATVEFFATGSGNALTQPASVTDAAGVATGRISATLTGTKVISAVAGGTVALDSLTAVVVLPGAPASVVAIAGDGQSAQVSTAVTTLPAVRVSDAFGTVVPGATVTFAITGGGGSLGSPTVVQTDVAGEARPGTWTLGAAPGANTLSATVTGTGITGNPVTFTATALVGPPSATRSGIAASPTTIAASAGGTTSTITVRVRDANGNPIPGASVTLAASGTGNTVTQPAAVTNASGVTTGTVSSTVAAVKVVTATVNGTVAVDSTASVTVTAAAASQLAMITQPAGAVANAAFTTQPVVEVRDAFGNRVTTATTAITVARATGEGTLVRPAGSLTINAVAGRVTFTDLRFRGPSTTGDTIGVGSHSLSFTAAGLTTATSSAFVVDPSFAYNVQFMVRLPSPLGCVGCHGATFANYTSLVNAPGVFNCTTSTRVVPFNTTNSLMYDVVRTTTPFCSVVMPSSTNRWSARLQNILRDWILRGALNN
jgi:adhesin/invasin